MLKAVLVLGLQERKAMNKKTAFIAGVKLYLKMGFIMGFNVINVHPVGNVLKGATG